MIQRHALAILLAAAPVWAGNPPRPPASIPVKEGYEVAKPGVPAKLVEHGTPVAVEDGTYNFQVPLVALEGAPQPRQGDVPAVKGRKTNLFLRFSTTTKMAVIVAIANGKERLIDGPFKEDERKKKLSDLAGVSPVALVMTDEAAIAVAVDPAPGASTQDLTAYERAVKDGYLTEEEKKGCATDAACRLKIQNALLAYASTMKDKDEPLKPSELKLIEKRLGADHLLFDKALKAADAHADQKKAFAKKARAALIAEANAYLNNLNPDQIAGNVKSLVAQPAPQRQAPPPANAALADALAAILPGAQFDHERTVLDRYYARDAQALAHIKSLVGKPNAANDPKFADMRKTAARAVRAHLAAPAGQRPASPLEGLEDDTYLDYICDARVMQLSAPAAPPTQAQAVVDRLNQQTQQALDTEGRSMDGRGVAAAPDQLAARCQGRNRPAPQLTGPDERGFQTPGAPPKPGSATGQPTDEKPDKQPYRDIIAGVKSSILFGLAAFILSGGALGPALMIGAVGFGVGWYISRDNAAK